MQKVNKQVTKLINKIRFDFVKIFNIPTFTILCSHLNHLKLGIVSQLIKIKKDGI